MDALFFAFEKEKRCKEIGEGFLSHDVMEAA